jgi:hypothetical protein
MERYHLCISVCHYSLRFSLKQETKTYHLYWVDVAFKNKGSQMSNGHHCCVFHAIGRGYQFQGLSFTTMLCTLFCSHPQSYYTLISAIANCCSLVDLVFSQCSVLPLSPLQTTLLWFQIWQLHLH